MLAVKAQSRGSLLLLLLFLVIELLCKIRRSLVPLVVVYAAGDTCGESIERDRSKVERSNTSQPDEGSSIKMKNRERVVPLPKRIMPL